MMIAMAVLYSEKSKTRLVQKHAISESAAERSHGATQCPFDLPQKAFAEPSLLLTPFRKEWWSMRFSTIVC